MSPPRDAGLAARTLSLTAVGLVQVALLAFVALVLEPLVGLPATLLTGAAVLAVAGPFRERVEGRLRRALGPRAGPAAPGLAALHGGLADGTAREDDVVALVRETVASYTGADVEVLVGDEQPGAGVAAGDGPGPGGGAGEPLEVPVGHAGRRVATIRLRPAGGRALTASEAEGVRDIGRLAAPALDALALRRRVREEAAELGRSRQLERRRLAGDLHDRLGPGLAALKMSLRARQGSRPVSAPELTAAGLARQARDLAAELRRLADGAGPAALDRDGLVGALEVLAGRLSVDGDCHIEVRSGPGLDVLPPAVQETVFAVALEALSNVARHARASRCVVDLSANPASVRLRVADDGIGIPDGVEAGVGVRSLRARAAEAGGSIAIRAAAGGGTEVVLAVPVAGSTDLPPSPAPPPGTSSQGAGTAARVGG